MYKVQLKQMGRNPGNMGGVYYGNEKTAVN